jgi:oxalate decarboxylase
MMICNLLFFFNNERPEDLGISGSFGAYSNEILASVFRIQHTTLLNSIPKYQEDLFIAEGRTRAV